jgi:2-furoate---CoA ligase
MEDNGRGLIATVERDPDVIAIVDGQKRISYAVLLKMARHVAGGLDDMGLQKGDHVVTLLQNTWHAAVLHWACQISGIIITPLNWRANADELTYFATDSEARAIFYHDIAAQAVNGAEIDELPKIAIETGRGEAIDFGELLAAPPMTGAPRAGADDTSLMLYTSGTTGAGKGVPRSHRAERAAAVAHVAQNRYGYGERNLGIMPLYHTMGVRVLLAMSVVGGCYVCQSRFDAAEALDLIAREKITSLYLVPTLYHDLINVEGFKDTDVSSVRKLGFAGAAMTDGLLARLDHLFAPELFVNHYGSSEVYTFTICDAAAAKPGSAGKAGINQQIRIVALDGIDPNAVIPAGEEGQIIASLSSVEAFQGYWKRPDADEKSIRDGWYFTGDVGYMDEAGDLFVTGRVDDMIISGGENILPAEIESLLSMHPDVSEVAVVGLPHERWGQQVTAFIKESSPINESELDQYCRHSELANFKRPRAYVFIDVIPKSPVGKILRRTLRDTYAAKDVNHTLKERQS